MLRNKKTYLAGFTLIEVLTVIAIIGILITISVSALTSVQMKSRDSQRKSNVLTMRAGLDLFKDQYKVYPNFTYTLAKPSSGGGQNSYYFEIDAESPGKYPFGTCPASGSLGSMDRFATAGTDYKIVYLKEGYVSVMNFLICLKYLETDVSKDLGKLSGAASYQYRVNYDYTEMTVSTQLENANDKDLSSPADIESLNGELNKRFVQGNGKNNYMLSDFIDTIFTGYNGDADDGMYVYQCKKDKDNVDIIPDNRSSYEYAPLVYDPNTKNWGLNNNVDPSCRGTYEGSHVVQAYGPN